MTQSQKKPNETPNNNRKRIVRKVLKIFLISLSSIIIILGFLYWYTFARKIPLNERFDRKSDLYAFVVPQLKAVKGVGGLSAENCKTCHPHIYKEWSQTTHFNALADIQLQSELTKMSSPKWLCLNCHIPIQNQREYIITDLQAGFAGGNVYLPVKKDNPEFDPKLQKEAITCAVCHIRRDDKGESYIIGPYGSKMAPHPVKQDKDFLQNICLRCHNPTGEGVTENLVCWFDTKDELEEGQSELLKLHNEKQSCVSCHMPSEHRRTVPFMKHLKIREGKRHDWVGGGIPKWFKDYDMLIARGYKRGLEVKVNSVSQNNDKINLNITIKNARAGHYMPTADPERFISMIAKIEDKNGKTLNKKTYRIGQHWEWQPAKKIADNRLKQGEEREWKVALDIPKEKINEHKIVVTAIHVKVTSENAKHMMDVKDVNEKHFPNGQHYVENAIDYYPMASFVYKEDIDLQTGKSLKIYTLKELIKLSKQEKGKPLKDREY